jgi:hypothetical protein
VEKRKEKQKQSNNKKKIKGARRMNGLVKRYFIPFS